ncbi:protoporphyrinogen oxidase [Saccharibacillus endophyticus]|uniref:Coproporphyrinogen III oxidase n=1 Tax=Saccharibacillus endophyticus TaxID=2060666 RepID=A0ABQ1ZLX8_9BACL|nr:protoporphyrinogen oxidase [Saccharibacillus endophyticus]GGH69980.1 protoporphyrinogen oxidase [Saccharibacillus endophyticus]
MTATNQKTGPCSTPQRILVLGGGISGLASAFYLAKQAKEQGISLEITIVEESEQLGGRLRTENREGCLIEKGPDSFIARKTAILDLTAELGLTGELVPTNPNAKTSYILHKGKMHPMPMGFILGIPTKLSPFIRTGLISPMGKLRAALDLVLPKKQGKGDEALGDFIERRLGKEVLERITEPLLAGIYAGDTRSLSLNATFPQFKAMEEREGSLIKGMARGGGRPKGNPAPDSKSNQGPSGTGSPSSIPGKTGRAPALSGKLSKSMFLSYQGGLSALVARLEQHLRDSGVQVITGARAASFIKKDLHGYEVTLDSGQCLKADGVICALPAFEAARLLNEEVPAAQRLSEIDYVSVANIALAYRTADLNISFERSGFLVPRKEGRLITACTWSSTKWQHVAPEGQTLLRTYIGRSGAQQWTSMEDRELIEAAKRDLRELTGLDTVPQWAEVSRCLSAMPQYPVGHVEMLNEVRSGLENSLPGVLLCGAGYNGVGIPDCVAGGRDAAAKLLEGLPALMEKAEKCESAS